MGATTGLFLALGICLACAVLFALALVRTATRADDSSERLLAECLRERERALAALASATIEARRASASDVAVRLSHRRTSQQPSSV